MSVLPKRRTTVAKASADTLIVYKALKNGVSPYQSYRWPLPHDGQPGDWVDASIKAPALCSWGVHGYLDRKTAEKEGDQVFEMEITGGIVKDTTKAAGRRGRLLRQLSGVVNITLGDVGAAITRDGATADSALVLAANNLGVTISSLETALPYDAYVIADDESLVLLRDFLKRANADIGDAFERRVRALARYPMKVQVARVAA